MTGPSFTAVAGPIVSVIAFVFAWASFKDRDSWKGAALIALGTCMGWISGVELFSYLT